jgi:hypothetical protein
MKIFALTLLFLGSVFNSYTQDLFSADREKFVKEFQKILTEYGKGEYQDFAKKTLPLALLESQDFSEKSFTRMVETCNLMITKKLSPYPEVYNYVYSVYSLTVGKQSETSFNAWHSSVDKMLDNRNVKKFEDFIELSAGFFAERRIAESSNFSWFYIGGTYSFEFTDKPFIKCAEGNLVCRVQNRDSKTRKEQPYSDSLVVYKTAGIYDPILKKWDGSQGTVNWQKVGVKSDETYATIGKYDVSCKMSSFQADSVMLTSPYFQKQTLGTISDRAFIINREEDRIYPQFNSYERKLSIKGIRENIDYEGGFSLQGASFVGIGTPQIPAKIVVMREGIPFVKASAQQIYIYPQKITMNNAAIAVKLNTGDSITHPGLRFDYDLDKKTLDLTRTATGSGQSPFSDSYHKLDIYVSKISWKNGDQDIFFTFDYGTSQEQRVARFESMNYFDERLFDRLQGLQSTHPLASLSAYCFKYDEYILTEGKAATALGLIIDQAKPVLLELASYGFITYDVEAKIVTVNPKTENFVLSKAGKRDFDNLNFVADFRPKELKGYSDDQIRQDPNLQALVKQYKAQTEERRMRSYFGKLNLGTLDIDLDGVDLVVLSDVQNSTLFPALNRVTIRENRNFEFSGWMNIGKMEMNTLAANYNYNENKVTVLKTDATLFRVKNTKVEDVNRPIPMLSVIKGIQGEIVIDEPTNRSGYNKSITQYPKMKVSKPSFVYYNSKAIYRGAYDSTRFFYTVAPFEIDSLDNFSERAFRLKGELTSAGIFPKITEDLKIMPDFSFGFSTRTPEGGYEFYGTKAKYDNKILLSNNGLQGVGVINFVQSTSEATSLWSFLPDSTIGYAKFTNRPVESGIEFPDVESPEAYISYQPKQSVLRASSTPKAELSFFKAEAKLRGTAIVTQNGIRGTGLMSFNKATTVSDNYRFYRWDIKADTAGFNLKNTYAEPGENALAFAAENVKADISFKKREGNFVSNKGTSLIKFPINQYQCRMDKFQWFMDKDEMQLEKGSESDVSIDAGLDLAQPNFFSTHPKQDSLQFRAPKAKYDLKQKSLFCDKVPYLEIADARIYTDSMKVTIRKNAKMEPFTNARIVANYITKYHNFVKVNVEVTGRRAYSGTGEYPYYDKDSALTYIIMKRITLDTSFQTIASGAIDTKDEFKLSKEFDYYGKVAINASNPLIAFEGATRINHTCENFERSWLSFSAQLDPKNIQIPVAEKMKNLDGQAITAGIVWRNSAMVDSIAIYPTFLSKLVQPSDPIIMTASGYLQYNPLAKEFQIASKEKLLNRSEKGNFISLHTESCSLNGEGVVNLGMDYGDLTVDAVGVAKYDQTSGSTTLNLTARISMAIDKGIMKDLAARLSTVENLKPINFNQITLSEAILQWSDQKTADKIKSDYTISGEFKKVPAELETAMVITGLKLESFDNPNTEEKGLISSTSSAIIVNIFDKPLMKMMPAKAFFQQVYNEAGGDRFGLMFTTPSGLQYYFDYQMVKKDGTMKIVTDDQDLSNAIIAMKEEKRKTKNFYYEATTQSIYLSKFLRLFEK